MSIWVIEWREPNSETWVQRDLFETNREDAEHAMKLEQGLCPDAEFRIVEYVRKEPQP